MSEPHVTEADREKAAEVVARLPISLGDYRTRDLDAARDVIAAALAEEREKTRAPFLALADDWERQTGLVANHDDLVVSIASSTLANVVRGIRRAVEDPS